MWRFVLFAVGRYINFWRMSFSSSLTSCLAVLVLAAIVWVGLVFHSLVSGIEEHWVSQLTALHAPLTLVPSEKYYHSDHYLGGFYSEDKGYLPDSFSARAFLDAEEGGAFGDPLQEAQRQLKRLSKETPFFSYSSFENTGGLLTVWIPTSLSDVHGGGKEVSQMVLVAPFPSQSVSFQNLLLEPTLRDINYFLQVGVKELTAEEKVALCEEYLRVEEVKLRHNPLPISLDLLPEDVSFLVQEDPKKKIFYLCDNPEKNIRTIKRVGSNVLLLDDQRNYNKVDYPIVISTQSLFQASLFYNEESKRGELFFLIQGKIADVPLKGTVPLRYFSVTKAHCKTYFASSPKISPPWVYKLKQNSKYSSLCVMPHLQNIQGLLLPKQLQKQGAAIGSLLSFNLPTITRQGYPAMVVGFYDCGLIPLGPRTVIGRQSFIEDIRRGSPPSSVDQGHEEGFHVWPQSLKDTQNIAEKISYALHQKDLLPFWQIFTYLQYPFVSDIFAQFQSDKLLFLIVFFIMFLIACSNIVSFLIILTQEKMKEIGLFRMFGCGCSHIIIIFSLLGGIIGLLGSVLGIFLAYLTLQNLPTLISLLAQIQGLQETLPLLEQAIALPLKSVLYTIVFIPVFTILVALFPSWYAASLDPSQIFRSPHAQ